MKYLIKKTYFLVALIIIFVSFFDDAIAQPVTDPPTCTLKLISPKENAELTQRQIKDGKVSTYWRFSWSKCPSASRYHLYVIGPGALNPVVNSDNLTETSFVDNSTHYGITSLVGWSWKVRAFVNGTWEEWSDTRTFNVEPVPCSITGRVSGNLKFKTTDDTGQPVTYELTHIYLATPGTTTPLRARIQGNTYTFSNLPSGKTYRIFPGNYRAQPRDITITGKPNTTYTKKDFKITGPPAD